MVILGIVDQSKCEPPINQSAGLQMWMYVITGFMTPSDGDGETGLVRNSSPLTSSGWSLTKKGVYMHHVQRQPDIGFLAMSH